MMIDSYLDALIVSIAIVSCLIYILTLFYIAPRLNLVFYYTILKMNVVLL